MDYRREAERLAAALEGLTAYGSGSAVERGRRALADFRRGQRRERDEANARKQGDLFGKRREPVLVPGGRQQTSIDAAMSTNAEADRARILEYLRKRPATVDEIRQALGFRGESTAAARTSSLHSRGLIRDSGERRPTRTGRAAIVWEING